MGGPESSSRTCPACGEPVERREAREYDPHASPWSLRGTHREFLCHGCFAALERSPRVGLEARLIDIGAGRCDRATFLRRYLDADRPPSGSHGDGR